MPIDHRMLLQQPPTMDLATPLNMYMNMKAERRAQQEQEYVQRQRAKQEQKASDMQNLATMFQGDREGYLSNLAAKYPREAMKQQQEFAVQDKTQLELLKLRREDTDSQKKRKGMWAKNIIESENPTFAFENAVMGMNEEGLELPPYYLDGNLTPEIRQELEMDARFVEEDGVGKSEYGLKPIPVLRNNKIEFWQAKKTGGAEPIDFGPGVQALDPDYNYIDQGGHFEVRDQFNRVVGKIPKTLTPKQAADVEIDKAEEDREKEAFKQKQIETARKNRAYKQKNKSALNTVQDFLDTSYSLIEEKNLDKTTGARRFWFGGSKIPVFATKGKDLQADIDYLVNLGVIEKMAQLKEESPTGSTGFGALSEKEMYVLQSSFSILGNPEIGTPKKRQAIGKIIRIMERRAREQRKYDKEMSGFLEPEEPGKTDEDRLLDRMKIKR